MKRTKLPALPTSAEGRAARAEKQSLLDKKLAAGKAIRADEEGTRKIATPTVEKTAPTSGRKKKTAIGQEDFIKLLPYLEPSTIAELLQFSPEWQHGVAALTQDDSQELPTDPVEFMRDTLGYAMWDKLEAICRSVEQNHNTVVESSFGTGKCQHYDDAVFLADGSIVKASSLIGKTFSIIGFDKSDWSIKSMLATAEDNGLQQCRRITLSDGTVITRTTNHPLLTWDGWKSNIEVGDRIAIPLNTPFFGNESRSDDEVKMLAYLLSEGGTKYAPILSQSPGVVADDMIATIQNLGCAVRLDGTNICFSKPGGNQSKERGLNNIAKLCRGEWNLQGKSSYTKTVPDFVYRMPREKIALFLRTLYSGDGWVCSKKGNAEAGIEIGYSSSSLDLALCVKRLLLRFGIRAKIRSKISCRYHTTSYSVDFHGAQNSRIFFERIGIILGKEKACQEALEVGNASKPQRLEHDIIPNSAWKPFKALFEERRYKHDKIPYSRPNNNCKQKLSRIGLRDLEQYFGVDLFNGWSKSDIGWATVKKIEILDNQPTVAIYVPETHAYVTDVIDHNSVTASAIACWYLVTQQPAIVITVAPTFNQVANIIWRYIRTVARQANLPGQVFETPRWEIAPNHYAIGLSPKKDTGRDGDTISTLQGFHGPRMLVIMDEAAGLPKAIWDSVNGLAVGDQCRILAIGNPIEQAGPFYDATQNPSWHHIRISAFDHPNVKEGTEVIPGAVTRSWVEERAKEWATEVSPGTPNAVHIPWIDKYYDPMPIFEAKVLGVPPEQAEDQLIKLSWVLAAQDRALDTRDAETVIGVDPAPRGGDDNSICVRRGMQVLDIFRIKGQDTQQITNWLDLRMKEYLAVKAYIDDVGCFDDQTDILTQDGWKRFADVSLDDMVLTMNPDTFEAFYTRPTQLFAHEYNGPMMLYESKTANFCVTPNHNMFYRGEKSKHWTTTPFNQIDIEYLRFKRTFTWQGKEVETFTFPSVTKKMVTLKKGTNEAATGNHTIREYESGELTVLMDDWLPILGWLLSEGHTYRAKEGKYYVGITQQHADRIPIIEQQLDKLGLHYYKKYKIQSNPCCTFLITQKQIYEEVHSYGSYAGEKHVPDYVKELSPRQIRLFLDTFLLGDGSKHKGTSYYRTTSRKMADEIQELVFKCGGISTISSKDEPIGQWDDRVIYRNNPVYSISDWREITDATVDKSNIKTINYNGMIYCVTVEPYHLIFTRRQGKCLWTGNSGVGVTDKARAMGLPILPVNFGRSASQKKRFANLRAECWWRVRELLREGKLALPNDPKLTADLVMPKYMPDQYGRIILESKDDIRARLGRSPDSADSLALTFALPIGAVDEETAHEIKRLGQPEKDGGLAQSRWTVSRPPRSSRWRAG